MSSDEIIDAHAERLRVDPGYQEIWHKVQTAKPEHRLLVAMLLWANDAMILRTLCGEHALRRSCADGSGEFAAPVGINSPATW